MRVLPALGLLVAALYLATEHGYLAAYAEGGPLQFGMGGTAGHLRPGGTPGFQDRARVEGAPVTFESSRARLRSPGLEHLGPLTVPRAESGQCFGCTAKWPPDGARKPGRLADDQAVAWTVRAQEPGFYYLADIRTRYRQGRRRFEARDLTSLCLQVARRRTADVPCGDPDRVATFEGLADIGGPSDYGDGVFRDERVEFRYRPGGELALTLTISNRAGENRRLTTLGLPDVAGFFEAVPMGPVTIPAGEHRSVPVRARYVGDCERFAPGASYEFDRLEAGEDDVELSIPIAVTRPRSC